MIEKDWRIYCTQAIEMLPPDARMGILLHEIGHIHLTAFHGDASEVDVDEWILLNVREAKYTYADVRYRAPQSTMQRDAKNLQRVGWNFLETIHDH